ncbi:MAG: hypothetical protein A6F72_05535 [Cycloclasticus sp. symbiont of Poecilosclerida sp. N]|nr:MAG: hypothetical protein A6F72_05535 [Cycloclasticus sp. symbiont of Poecilosclerida sp. N]
MTGKPSSGVSHEITEHDAAKFLVLELSEYCSQGFKRFEAKRADVFDHLNDNENTKKRGAIPVTKFRHIAELLWIKDGSLDRAVWHK